MANLIYIADPMCPWCYGFTPELTTLTEGLPGMPLQIIMGGLHAYATQAATASEKESFHETCEKVSRISGLPFSGGTFPKEAFIYNTEPACRAVVAARHLAPNSALEILYTLQRRFFVEGDDITNGEILAAITAETLSNAGHAITAEEFLSYWASLEMISATHADFLQTKQWNVSGFPTLLLENQETLHLINSGYQSIDQLIATMEEIITPNTSA